MSSNISWYKNNDPEQGLNPRLKFINYNSDEENEALLEWASELWIGLADPNESKIEIEQNKDEHRLGFTHLLEDCFHTCFDIEAEDYALRGFGTLEEHELYQKLWDKEYKAYCKSTANYSAYCEATANERSH